MRPQVQLGTYPYTYLRTIVMKKHLLDKSDYDKIMKMHPEQISKYLEEFEYKKEINQLGIEFQGIELLERTLELNLCNMFTKLVKISPPELRYLITLYLKRYEMSNLKTVIRAKYSGMEDTHTRQHLHPLGRSNLVDRLLAQKNVEDAVIAISLLSETEKRKAIDKYKEKQTVLYIENILDTHYFDEVMKSVRTLRSEGKLYKSFLQHEIDALNIRLLLVLKKEQISEDDIREIDFVYGNIDRSTIQKLIKMPEERILKELLTTDFSEVIKRHEAADGTIIDFEIDLDRYLMVQSLRLSRQHPMSVDVILGYMFLKNLEVKNLTRIIKAKELGLKEDFIERMIVI
ncbi:V-type ATPase subunit [Candidatus Woesearchaeota archaeon]|nr:V-type ATPase subunit [Candidatus Woesearchaeota archaeon]